MGGVENERNEDNMKIMDFLNPDAVTAGIKATTKKEVVRELVDLLVNTGEIKNKEELVRVLLARETLGSTGIGQGIGIPHGKSAHVKKLIAAFGLSKQGVDFESLDGEPTHIFFLLVAPEESAGPHLKALARISRLLKDKYFRDMLIKAEDEKDIIRIIKGEDGKRS